MTQLINNVKEEIDEFRDQLTTNQSFCHE